MKKVLPVLLLWTAVVFAQNAVQNPFAETERAMGTAARVFYYLLALVVAVLALAPFVFGFIMGCKSYQQAIEAREGNPATAGIKAFALWVILIGLISFFVYYFMNTILSGQLNEVINKVIADIFCKVSAQQAR